MEETHLDERALRLLTQGTLSPRRRLLTHLHALSCDACRPPLLQAMGAGVERWTREVPYLLALRPSADRQGAEDPLGPSPTCQLAPPDPEAHEVARLLVGHATEALPPCAVERVLAQPPRWGLVELLLAQTRRLFAVDACLAEQRASLALSVSRLLDPADYHDAFRHDLEALAWTYLGDCRRLQFDAKGAQEALSKAETLLVQGSGQPLERAELLFSQGAMLRDDRRFEEAERPLEQAQAIYRWAQLEERELEILATLVSLHLLQGNLSRTGALLRRLLRRLSKRPESRLHLLAQQAVGLYLLQAGQSRRALKLLPQLDHLVRVHGSHLDLARRDRLEAQILTALGETSRARSCFESSFETFLAAGCGYDASLVLLEYIALELAVSDGPPEPEPLLAKIDALLGILDLRREALSALTVFRRALAEGEASPDLARNLGSRLLSTTTAGPLRHEPPS